MISSKKKIKKDLWHLTPWIRTEDLQSCNSPGISINNPRNVMKGMCYLGICQCQCFGLGHACGYPHGPGTGRELSSWLCLLVSRDKSIGSSAYGLVNLWPIVWDETSVGALNGTRARVRMWLCACVQVHVQACGLVLVGCTCKAAAATAAVSKTSIGLG